jgi:alginate O-acetyltransferase complex protein AlgI
LPVCSRNNSTRPNSPQPLEHCSAHRLGPDRLLFNSYAFLIGFLPLTLLAVWLASRHAGDVGAIGVLLIASAIFLAWQSWRDLALLAFSIPVNFAVAIVMWRSLDRPWLKLAALSFGIVLDVLLLALYKIPAGVWANGIGQAGGGSGTAGTLPLAISFYTFHQIAFLVDTYRRQTPPIGLGTYALFVSFFPQLIAGPIVRWRQVANQLSGFAGKLMQRPHTMVGLLFLSVGLAKKVLIADPMGLVIGPIYATARDTIPTTIEALAAGFGFAFQVYFDFSAYSDIAIGVGLMFGIFLPVNFLSPFKATSFREFWTTWHITLSNFLHDYIYVPLGGSSKRFSVRGPAMFVTFVISGVWHGVGLTFILFGLFHAFLVLGSQIRRRISGAAYAARPAGLALWRARAIVVTGFALTLILFRSPDIASAVQLFKGLLSGDLGTGKLPPLFWPALGGILVLVWGFPNTPELFGQTGTPEERDVRTRSLAIPTWWALGAGLLLGLVLVKLWGVGAKSEFIYFAF